MVEGETAIVTGISLTGRGLDDGGGQVSISFCLPYLLLLLRGRACLMYNFWIFESSSSEYAHNMLTHTHTLRSVALDLERCHPPGVFMDGSAQVGHEVA